MHIHSGDASHHWALDAFGFPSETKKVLVQFPIDGVQSALASAAEEAMAREGDDANVQVGDTASHSGADEINEANISHEGQGQVQSMPISADIKPEVVVTDEHATKRARVQRPGGEARDIRKEVRREQKSLLAAGGFDA